MESPRKDPRCPVLFPAVPRHRRGESGYVLALTATLLFLVLFVGIAFATLTSTTGRLAYRGAMKAQADALADAAVQRHYDSIRTAMKLNQAWNGDTMGSLTSASLIANDGSSRNDGTYSSQASLVGTPTVTNDTANNRQVTQTVIQLTGTGVASNGTRSTAYATFNVTQEAQLATASPVSAFASDVVIQSNTTIQINSNQGVRTYSNGTPYGGSILANDGVVWTPASGNKGTNPNVITIQGQVLTGSAAAASMTASPSGMGNSNGTKNYQTQSSPARDGVPASTANSITNMGAPRSYPDENAVAGWETAWRISAKTGTTLSGNVSTNSAPQHSQTGERRITAPAYITGNLDANSNQLYLQPPTDPTKPNIVFVEGNITNSSLLYNRGVMLICKGRYIATNTSAQYTFSTQYSPYTEQQLYEKTALVSLSAASNAIDMSINTSVKAGLIYAPVGGIRCVANNNMYAVLVAGGSGANGGVNISAQNSFDITFVAAAVQNRSEFQYTPGGGGSGSGSGSGAPGQISSTTVGTLGQFFWPKG